LYNKPVAVHIEGTFASLPRTERGKAIVIGGDPKGKNFLYTNGTSVIIRDIAVRILQFIGLHRIFVTGIFEL